MDIDSRKILEELGKETRNIREEIYHFPTEGTNTKDIVELVEKKIKDKGFLPAFPCTVCRNEMAAHYTPFDEGETLEKGDVVKVDFGLYKKGLISDNAFTVEIGTQNYKHMMECNLEGLNKIMDNAEVGVSMSELGNAVNEIAQKNGYNTIHNLSGHEIGIDDLHCGLNVPSYDNEDKKSIEKNMELAVEPFFTTGEPKVKNSGPSNILSLTSSRPIRDPIANKILKHIKENHSKLPFAKRWLLEKFEKRKVLYALNVLKKYNMIYEYEALSSVDSSIITQFEDAVIFDEEEKVIITRLK